MKGICINTDLQNEKLEIRNEEGLNVYVYFYFPERFLLRHQSLTAKKRRTQGCARKFLRVASRSSFLSG